MIIEYLQYFFGHFHNLFPFKSINKVRGPIMFIRKSFEFISKFLQ